jgi:hypothetical protein
MSVFIVLAMGILGGLLATAKIKPRRTPPED